MIPVDVPRTANPFNRNLGPGGSSGGEAALIASYGSPLGVGTDIGGSLRIPASATGLFTIRFSGHRLPNFDFRAGVPGQEAIVSVQGPLARTLEDVVLYSKSIIDTEPWLQDPKLLPIPWRNVEVPQKLKFAVIWDDGFVRLTPPVKRALETTVEKLRRAGHEVVEWDNKPIAKAYGVITRLFTVDGGRTIRNQIEAGNEPWPKPLETFSNLKEVGTYDLWQLQRERNQIWKEWLDQWNAAEGLDGLLMATAPYIAARHLNYKHIGYTALFNLLDYSAAVFPSGVVADKDIDVKRTDDLPELNPLDKATRDDCKLDISEMKDSHVDSLQMIQKKFMVCLSACSSLEEGCKRREFSPWLAECWKPSRRNNRRVTESIIPTPISPASPSVHTAAILRIPICKLLPRSRKGSSIIPLAQTAVIFFLSLPH